MKEKLKFERNFSSYRQSISMVAFLVNQQNGCRQITAKYFKQAHGFLRMEQKPRGFSTLGKVRGHNLIVETNFQATCFQVGL